MRFNFSSKASTCLITILALMGPEPSRADEKPEQAPPPASALQKVRPGVFQFNGVTLDNGLREVSFPAMVNMNSNLVEYVLVGNDGKTHESLLKTSVEPRDIHVAMLLIGAKGSPPQDAAEPDQEKVLQGDRIRVWIEWESKGDKRRVRAEDLVINDQTQRPMKQGDWIYNGSWMFNGRFVAQTERSVVSIIFDRDALINSGHPQRADDEIWFANTKRIPKPGHPVRVKLEILAETSPTNTDKK